MIKITGSETGTVYIIDVKHVHCVESCEDGGSMVYMGDEFRGRSGIYKVAESADSIFESIKKLKR